MTLGYTNVASPAYNDAAGDQILCTVQFAGFVEPVAFVAQRGEAGVGGAIFAQCLDGAHGAIAPFVTPSPNLAQLKGAAFLQLSTLLAASRTYALGGGVSVACDASTQTGADLAGLNLWGAANPAATTQWVDGAGDVTAITGAQAQALAAAVVAYGQSAYAVLASVAQGIASGAITSVAAVVAAAWPS